MSVCTNNQIGSMDLYEIRNVLAPSALIEILFHDEWTQANFILNNKQEIADSFFKGIVSYFQQVD